MTTSNPAATEPNGASTPTDPPANGSSADPPANGQSAGASDPAASATASSPAPDAKSPDSAGCSEIPAYPHAVLTADVKLALEIPRPPDEASQLPYKFTLSNDDGSYTKTLTLASDCQPGTKDGTSVITFEGLTEHHTYSLECDDGSTTFKLFENVDYADVPNIQAEAAPPPDITVDDFVTRVHAADDGFEAAVAAITGIDIPTHDPPQAAS
jgi:hypothetical protein